MNRETKLMTAVAIIAYANVGIALFAQATPMAYKIAAFILAGIAWACSHYFNQDFTEEACEGTGYSRYLKARKNPNVYTEPVEEEEGDDDVQD